MNSERGGKVSSNRGILAFAMVVVFLLASGPAQTDTLGITSVPYIISQPGSYALAQDLTYTGSGDAILITGSDVDLDGNGHTVTGNSPGAGIHVIGASGVKIHGVKVAGFDDGIFLVDASNNTLTGNAVSNNLSGIVLVSASHNTLTGNTASSNKDTGIHLFNISDNNTVIGNTASSNLLGIVLVNSSSNTLTGNTAGSNAEGIVLEFGSGSNRVEKNTASSNTLVGINVAATSVGNTLVHNTAQGNSQLDLTDLSLPACQNGWADNTFGTDNEGGIAAGPAFGCIR